MSVPVFILTLASAVTVIGLFAPGWSDLLLIGPPAAIAALVLLLRFFWRRPKAENLIILDGSNVMHWKDGTPRLEIVASVLRDLEAAGYTPGVVFDANAGYLLSGHYRHDGDLGRALKLPSDRVMVVPKGTPADPYILRAARDMGARIVTNDRYRDWAEDFPEITQKGHLIRGGVRQGRIWLDLAQAAARA
ncbi:NYN domain-containing protein [Alterinioella nitratireducens]|uniref:NYN domain-containing protein n=1 Tax=Alterinioella nitratireducens TaxID=2735915 RepID=UPI001556D2D0|nr:hypothetical protein [Alterinioella nitratireducens]NPD18381.1 hypothetical protein [Alterinioella nitratireducens]